MAIIEHCKILKITLDFNPKETMYQSCTPPLKY